MLCSDRSTKDDASFEGMRHGFSVHRDRCLELRTRNTASRYHCTPGCQEIGESASGRFGCNRFGIKDLYHSEKSEKVVTATVYVFLVALRGAIRDDGLLDHLRNGEKAVLQRRK